MTNLFTRTVDRFKKILQQYCQEERWYEADNNKRPRPDHLVEKDLAELNKEKDPRKLQAKCFRIATNLVRAVQMMTGQASAESTERQLRYISDNKLPTDAGYIRLIILAPIFLGQQRTRTKGKEYEQEAEDLKGKLQKMEKSGIPKGEAGEWQKRLHALAGRMLLKGGDWNGIPIQSVASVMESNPHAEEFSWLPTLQDVQEIRPNEIYDASYNPRLAKTLAFIHSCVKSTKSERPAQGAAPIAGGGIQFPRQAAGGEQFQPQTAGMPFPAPSYGQFSGSSLVATQPGPYIQQYGQPVLETPAMGQGTGIQTTNYGQVSYTNWSSPAPAGQSYTDFQSANYGQQYSGQQYNAQQGQTSQAYGTQSYNPQGTLGYGTPTYGTPGSGTQGRGTQDYNPRGGQRRH
ncbi:hypothetical protein QBC37DRAFT_399031 [Rhypophila decipiens]|uniref:Uncharacterized protein n=1 Tax=Rhypophila decipiens TaxID=261697 RepID=A0AAN6YBS7_9PEZI|nr:hypothetical protein QBC37DRAFT_399031 [Rhypophila decipiens]